MQFGMLARHHPISVRFVFAARLSGIVTFDSGRNRTGGRIAQVYRAGMYGLSIATNVILASIVGVILAGVLVRYLDVLQGSLDWAVEYSRFAIIWLIMLGSAVALDRGAHVGIDFTSLMPPTIRRALRGAASGVSFVFIAVLAWQGFILSAETMRQISPALHLPMGYAYLAVPIGATIMAVQSLLFMIRPDLMMHWKPGSG